MAALLAVPADLDRAFRLNLALDPLTKLR
jgi:hypothetical protein